MMGQPSAGVMVAREDHAPQAVWKFELEPDGTSGGRCRIWMPEGKPVSVGAQEDRYFIWAVVAPGSAKSLRTFYVVTTGKPVPTEAHTYLGRITRGPFESHVFEGFR